jgi:TolA-binding protein
MNRSVDVHPEDLLDHERSGTITKDELARLDSHTSVCAPCAVARAAVRDFEAERRSQPGDAALVNRMSNVALEAAASLGGVNSLYRSSFNLARPRRKRRAWAVAGVLMFAATGATASFWSVRHAIVSRLLVKTPSQAPVPAAEPRANHVQKMTNPPRVEFTLPPVEVAPLPASKANSSARAKPAEEAQVTTPEQLYAAANEARRHDPAEATKLYHQLQQQFPGTREEINSRFTLARFLLDRGEDPAQALALFTRYLAANGTLAEEARLGRATALGRLGRTQEERQAWQELLAFHPNSIHAERARRRLDELR